VPGRAHAGTDAGRRPPPAQGRATGLCHPTRATSPPVTARSCRAASPDDSPLRQQNEVVMDRAYRGRPCPGGGHRHHQTRPGPQRVRYSGPQKTDSHNPCQSAAKPCALEPPICTPTPRLVLASSGAQNRLIRAVLG
jgi:hypothetical protein